MRMHHQKTGGNRNAGRNTVPVSVAVLLALVMLAAGHPDANPPIRSVVAALSAGAQAVSTTKPELWEI